LSGSPLARGAADKVYSNSGNAPLLDLVNPDAGEILDVGCGAGNNAALLGRRSNPPRVWGISGSENEANAARAHMEECWVADLESGLPDEAKARRYDVVLFSHVLEHLRNPAALVNEAASLLRPGGSCVIAVPNVLAWAQRLSFLRGSFEYQSAGVMDETHLRFFTFRTAASYLLAESPSLTLTDQRVTGSVPLWILRRHVLPRRASRAIDVAGCRLFPNLFGSEVLIRAIRKP
jgi:2-polyprenyl-3-methyl-5-hydroxy-6-metoxy-1,4-benzoquinol methylase